jgi:hypothetical protein
MDGLYKPLLEFRGTSASYQSYPQNQGDLSFENTFRNPDRDVAAGIASQFFAINVLHTGFESSSQGNPELVTYV